MPVEKGRKLGSYSVKDGKKKCTKCLVWLPVDQFGRRGGSTNFAHHFRSRCKECTRLENAERARSRGYAENRDRWLRTAYGISLQDYDAMAVAQNGLCALCAEANQNGRPLVVDHCHSTGAVRGLLCDNCNKALGLLKDDPERVRRMLAYLDGRT